jgi:hypothetical protein
MARLNLRPPDGHIGEERPYSLTLTALTEDGAHAAIQAEHFKKSALIGARAPG